VYTYTYDINYKETFAPVEKMDSVRNLISCAANFDWKIYQIYVKRHSFMAISINKCI
jgi:hypothetical protein